MAKKTPTENWNAMDNYLIKIKLRITDLELQSKDLVKEASQRNTNLGRTVMELKTEIEHLGERLKYVRDEVDVFKKDIIIMTKEFKSLGKEDAFQKLKDKIDEWGPEKFITKQELMRKLKLG